MSSDICDVTSTEQFQNSECAGSIDLGPAKEELLEKAILTVFRLTGVIDNLSIIAQNLSELGLSKNLENDLLAYCQCVVDSGEVEQIRGSGGHKIRILIDKALDQVCCKYTDRAQQEVHQSLNQWVCEVARISRLSRDLVNRIFYRKKQRNRDLVELAAMEHPLVKSWEGLNPKTAVERISKSRMNKFLNRQTNYLEILLRRTNVQTYPSRMTLEPTSACNYRCTMCSQGFYTERPSYFEVDDDTIERSLPVLEFVENLATQVTGEPTLSLQLGKIANYASSHGVYIEMITNGSLLHKTNADLSKFSIICISFDGASKEIFEAQRVGSSFENVLNNIRVAREKFPLVEFEFNVCVTRLNISQLADIVRIAREIGIDRVLFNLLNTRDYNHLDSLALGANNLAELNNAINEAREAADGSNVRVFNFITDHVLLSNGTGDQKEIPDILNSLANMEKKNTLRTSEQTAKELIETEFPSLSKYLEITPIDKDPKAFSDERNMLELVNRETVAEKYEELLQKALHHLGKKIQLPYCTAPFKGGIIFSNGSYTPCCFMTTFGSFGTMSRNTFEHIWNSPGLQEFRRSMFDDSALLPVCRKCNGRQRYTYTFELLQTAHRLGYEWEDIEFPSNFNPPLALKKQIDALYIELFKPGLDYMPGTIIKFGAQGNARPYMSSGFSSFGANGVWNDGFESVLTFKLKKTINKDMLFKVSLLPFLQPDLLPQQRIEVYMNSSYIDTWCIKQAKINVCTIKAPVSLLRDDRRVQFVLRFPDASSWHALGLKNNKVTRSVMFIDAQLS